ncbi:Rz-like lysis system protein LysB [Lonsdalea quercina]|uniref:Rz-like lysis system protein LysB n=1 Tax=Lonsdalea quercina TaxID=71657 RepID=UPI003974782B
MTAFSWLLSHWRAVVLGLLAVALGMQSWRLHQIQQVAAQQLMTLTAQRTALDERTRQLREFTALAERNDREQARLRALAADTHTALAARQKTIARLTRENEEVRRWADARLPADVVRLRQRPALAGGHAYRQWVSQADAVPVPGGQPADQRRSE